MKSPSFFRSAGARSLRQTSGSSGIRGERQTISTLPRVLRASEFFTLTEAERKTVVETVVEQTNGRVPVVAGVSAASTQVAVEMVPGIWVYRIVDRVLKAVDVQPSAQMVEREFGMLAVHAFSQANVLRAGEVVLDVRNLALPKQDQFGMTLDGIGSALGQKITLENGRVKERTFADHPFIRMSQSPKVQVDFLLSDNNPTGLGEPALPPAIPALCNAIFAATGRRVRSLPIDLAALGA